MGPPVLIVIDTLHRHFEGDENDAADIGRLLQHLDLLREPYRASLLLLHHTGHGAGDRPRGTSSIRPTLDTELLVSRDDRLVTIKATKQKDAEPFEPMAFEICTVALPVTWNSEDGETTTSAVLRPTSYVAKDAPAGPRGAGQRKALEELRRLCAKQGESLTQAGRDPALVTIDEWRTAAAVDRRRWPEVRDGLEKAGLVVIEHPYVRVSECPK